MLWFALGGLAGLILLVAWVVTIGDLFSRHLVRGRTAAWLIIVLLLPFLGSVLYWVLREHTPSDVQYQVDSERALRESAGHRPFDSTGPI
jgi:hypothetical protein